MPLHPFGRARITTNRGIVGAAERSRTCTPTQQSNSLKDEIGRRTGKAGNSAIDKTAGFYGCLLVVIKADAVEPKKKGADCDHALWVASVDHSSGVSDFAFRRWRRFNTVPCSVSAIRSARVILRPLYFGFHLPHRPVEFSNASSRRKRIGFAGEEPSNLSISGLSSSGLVMDYASGVSDFLRPCRWLERLTTMWLRAFDLKAPRPLAVGIADTITAELNRTGAGGHGAVRYALRSYTGNIRYIRALAAGGLRYNLRGEPEGEVTPEQQQRAAEVLKTMKENKAMFTDEVAA